MRPSPSQAGSADETTPLLGHHGNLPVVQAFLPHVANDDISFLTPAIVVPVAQDSIAPVPAETCHDFDEDKELVESNIASDASSEVFIALGKARFWLVFGGICLNTFVCWFLIPWCCAWALSDYDSISSFQRSKSHGPRPVACSLFFIR
jgi:hypothetical protein